MALMKVEVWIDGGTAESRELYGRRLSEIS
jgi:hypothetical protein